MGDLCIKEDLEDLLPPQDLDIMMVGPIHQQEQAYPYDLLLLTPPITHHHPHVLLMQLTVIELKLKALLFCPLL